MTAAELDAIRAAAREAAQDAPPIPADVLEMLAADRCPVRRQSERAA